MSLSNVLLRRLRIHDAPPLLRRNQSLRKHPSLHLPHKTTPTPLISLRPTPKKSRPNVRPPHNLHCPHPDPSRRLNPFCSPREIRRTTLQADQGRGKGGIGREDFGGVVFVCLS